MYHITTMNFKPWYYSHLQKKLLVDAMTFGTEGQGRVMGGGGGGGKGWGWDFACCSVYGPSQL